MEIIFMCQIELQTNKYGRKQLSNSYLAQIEAHILAQAGIVFDASYSPQLNPEERLNASLKQEMGRRVPVRTNA